MHPHCWKPTKVTHPSIILLHPHLHYCADLCNLGTCFYGPAVPSPVVWTYFNITVAEWFFICIYSHTFFYHCALNTWTHFVWYQKLTLPLLRAWSNIWPPTNLKKLESRSLLPSVLWTLFRIFKENYINNLPTFFVLHAVFIGQNILTPRHKLLLISYIMSLFVYKAKASVSNLLKNKLKTLNPENKNMSTNSLILKFKTGGACISPFGATPSSWGNPTTTGARVSSR